MIESRQQVIGAFRAAATAFLQTPGVLTGMTLDDAAVTLKRYLLSESNDQATASLLTRLPRLIRELDTAAVGELVAQLEGHLAD